MIYGPQMYALRLFDWKISAQFWYKVYLIKLWLFLYKHNCHGDQSDMYFYREDSSNIVSFIVITIFIKLGEADHRTPALYITLLHNTQSLVSCLMQGLGVPFINDLNILCTASGTNLEKYLNVMLFIELEFFW